MCVQYVCECVQCVGVGVWVWLCVSVCVWVCVRVWVSVCVSVWCVCESVSVYSVCVCVCTVCVSLWVCVCVSVWVWVCVQCTCECVCVYSVRVCVCVCVCITGDWTQALMLTRHVVYYWSHAPSSFVFFRQNVRNIIKILRCHKINDATQKSMARQHLLLQKHTGSLGGIHTEQGVHRGLIWCHAVPLLTFDWTGFGLKVYVAG
jgi:hypothetical protein